jgi:hypothetical protein
VLTSFADTRPVFIIVPSLLLKVAIMIGLPLLAMRNSTRRLKEDLTNELNSFSKTKNPEPAI